MERREQCAQKTLRNHIDTQLFMSSRIEQFKKVIRTGVDPVDNGTLAVMPWPYYRNMTDRDLDAIYAYLSAIPRVRRLGPASLPGNNTNRLSDLLGSGCGRTRGQQMMTLRWKSPIYCAPKLKQFGKLLTTYGGWGCVLSSSLRKKCTDDR